MYVLDIDNKKIQITDLSAAITQAEIFSGYKTDPVIWHNKEKNISMSDYWAHLHSKLLLINTTNAQTTNTNTNS